MESLNLSLVVNERTAAFHAECVVSDRYFTAGEKATAIRNLLIAADSEEARQIIRRIGREFI